MRERITIGEEAMRLASLTGLFLMAVVGAAAAQPSTEFPDPFGPAASFGQLPSGRTWGGTTAVTVDADGKSVWVFERCGAESCADSKLPPILHFDPSGKLLASFG